MRFRHSVLLLALLVLIPLSFRAGSVAANGGLPTPAAPPTPPGGPPAGTAIPMRPMLAAALPGSPPDFHFTNVELYGQFFNPGEQVTITAERAAVSPITVTADRNGQFVAHADFTWVFCGPGGKADPPPAFRATGNLGSSDTLTLFPRPCPEIVTSQNVTGGTGSDGGSAGTVNVGTAVSGPPVTISTVVPSLPPNSGPPQASTPSPQLGTSAMETTNIVRGFGFQPGEGVRVAEMDSPSATPNPVSAVAGSQGEFQVTISLYVPGPCMGVPKPPQVVAVGDRGTTASARPANPPMPMYPCAIPYPAPVPAPTDVPTPATVTQRSRAAVTLTPKVTTAGATETARIQAAVFGTIRITVRYPQRSAIHWTVTPKSPGALRVRWTIPRTVHTGKVQFTALFLADNSVIRKSFTIR